MPIATVEDVLELALPAGTRILAGAGSIANEVAWVSVLHALPLVSDSIEGSELILLSPESLNQTDNVLFLRLLHQLTADHVAAVALVGEVLPEAIALADSLGLPLLSLPPGTRLQQVERAVMALIVNRRAELERRGVQIYRQLAQIEIEDRGIAAIVEALGDITGKTVALQDENLDLRYYSSPGLPRFSRDVAAAYLREQAGLAEWLRGTALVSTSPPIGHFTLPQPGMARFVAPIIIRGNVSGYISVLGADSELTELDRVATGRAASVCAIELAKQRAIIEAENRMRGDFVDDLLSGGFASEEAILARSKLLGYDLRPPYAVMIYGWDQPLSELVAEHGESDVQRLRIALDIALSDALSAETGRVLLRVRNDHAHVAYPVGQMAPDELERTAEQLRQRVVSRVDGVTISVGVSLAYHELTSIPQGYHQAEQALVIAQRLFGGSRTVLFDKLGIYRLLFPLHGTPELRQFHQEILSGLLEYDERHRADLVGTLKAFFAHHGNLTKVAEQLFVHRNTLTYRLDRIQKITGLDLDDPEDRLCLQLALKLEDML
ncbi:MAG: helix-turn-helix domain-containing protein [Chloroflexi bacterium]|nr:helix-turn-helix domain-containing protein [Chloroflexota bacterium]